MFEINTLSAQNVVVSYQLPSRRFTSLKEYLLSYIKGEKHEMQTFDALKGISIVLNRSECVGLVGRNGCGKSTLLKVLAGIISPTVGDVVHSGRLTSLIELGAGFDGELTAVDNIYLACTLMGVSQAEIKSRLNDIIEFAELRDFLNFPIKNYSSGMAARLGFACATIVEPEILLIDEVLAVGDEAFQQKCLQRIQELKKTGKSIVLVTHDMLAVERFCDRVYLLDHGRLVFEGDPIEGIRQYRQVLAVNQESRLDE